MRNLQAGKGGIKMSIRIAITNVSTVLDDATVQAAMRAIQAQDDQDLAPAWGLAPCTLYFLEKNADVSPATPPAGDWQMVIADNSDQAGALGYHETTANGDPIGFVFAKDCIADGVSWCVDWSHEHCEMRVDPDIQTVEEQDTDTAIVFRAKEICDPCEDDQYGYSKPIPLHNPPAYFALPDGTAVMLSDFVLPEYWNPNAAAGAKFDLMGHITKPLQILAGGYIGMLQARGAEWIQSTAETAKQPAAVHDGSGVPKVDGRSLYMYKRDPRTKAIIAGGKPIPPLSRRARRITKDSVWQKSKI